MTLQDWMKASAVIVTLMTAIRWMSDPGNDSYRIALAILYVALCMPRDRG